MAQVQHVTTRTTRTITPQRVDEETPQEKYESKRAIFRVYQMVWYLLGIFETLIALRIFLKASGANPASGFVNLIYSLSYPLVYPFLSMFRTVVEGEYVFELSSFVAGIVYLLLATGIVELFQIFKPTTPSEVEENI